MRPASFVLVACALGLVAVVACSSSSSDNAAPQPDAGDDGPTPPPPPPGDDAGDSGSGAKLFPTSGTRIVARYWDTADGAHVYSGLYDKTLGAACGLTTMDDDSVRCVVDSPASIVSFYGDDKCTTQLAVLAVGVCAPTSFVYEQIRGTGLCDVKNAVHKITSMTPVTTTFQKDAMGNCVSVTLPADQTYVPIGPRVAPSELVAFTEKDEPLTPGLALRVYTGDDGSRTPYVTPLLDTTRMKGCDAAFAGDGTPRCLPDSTLSALGLWSNMGCTAPVATDNACVVNGELVDPTVITRPGPESCTNTTKLVHEVGPVRASRDYYSGTPAMCTGPATSPKDLYDLGAEVPATTFPALAYGLVGGTRISEDAFQAGGVTITRQQTHDATEMDTCLFALAADGVTRCLPNQVANIGEFFSDMECKVPVAIGDEICGHVVKYGVTSEGEGCNAKTHLFALGTKSESGTATLWSTITGSCMPFIGSTGRYVWTVGAEVSPAGFAEGKLVEH